VQARKWYDQVAQWTDKHQPRDEELSRFRSEAGELLEVGTKCGNRSTGSAGLGLALVAEYARVLNLIPALVLLRPSPTKPVGA
jgi:hypothetical protein